MGRYFVYILYSEILNKTYVGFCSDLAKRIRRHNLKPTRTTKNSDDYKLVWYCRFFSKMKALRFERYLKTRSGRIFMRNRLLGELSSDDRE